MTAKHCWDDLFYWDTVYIHQSLLSLPTATVYTAFAKVKREQSTSLFRYNNEAVLRETHIR